MSVTPADLQSFTDYAHARINNGGVESMAHLLRDWLAEREREEVNAAIRAGLADLEAGRTRPADDFMAEVRERIALREREGTNAAIIQGLADVQAGRTEPFFEEAAEFRRARALPPRN